ncbi:MAG: hypothetical protein ACOX75_05830 [Lachnospiraceae bacterium]
MSKSILAIYDSPDYVNRFLMFLRTHKSLPFEPIGFTSLHALQEYLAVSVVNILLLSRDIITKDTSAVITNKTGREELQSGVIENIRNANEIVFLGEQQLLEGEIKFLNKYRSMRHVLKDLISLCRARGYEEVSPQAAEIYGIYALDPVRDRASFALNIAGSLSSAGPVLYINLDRFAGLDERFLLTPSDGISELIFYFKTNPELFRRHASSIAGSDGSVDILIAPDFPEDLDEITSLETEDFFSQLAAYGGYSAIVIDLTDSVKDLIKIFELCKSIYIYSEALFAGQTSDESAAFLISAFRANAFRKMLRRHNMDRLEEKMLPAAITGRTSASGPESPAGRQSRRKTGGSYRDD